MRLALPFVLLCLLGSSVSHVYGQGRFSTIVVDEPSFEAYINDVIGLPDGGFVMVGTALVEGADIYSAQQVAIAQRHAADGAMLWRQTFDTPNRTDRATRAQVVGEEVFVGLHTEAPSREMQPVYLWRLRLADGSEVSRTPLIHVDQLDTLGGIRSFAVVDDAVVIGRPILNWSRLGLLYTNGAYTFGLDGRPRGALKTSNFGDRSVASPADHSVYVSGNKTYRIRANGDVTELPQAQFVSDYTFDDRKIVALGEYVLYVEARGNSVAKRFVVVKTDGKDIEVSTKDFPASLWTSVAYDLVPYGTDSFTLTTFDERANSRGLHVFSKTGDYGRALPLHDPDLATPRPYEGRLYYAVGESPAGPPQRRHVLRPPSSVPVSVVDVVSGETLARAPALGTALRELTDARSATFGSGGTYVAVQSTPAGDRFVRFDVAEEMLPLAPAAFDPTAAGVRVISFWNRGLGDGYVVLGRATSGVNSIYVLREDLSLQSTIALDPPAQGRVVGATDPRGGFVYAWTQGPFIYLSRIERDGQMTQLPEEYLYNTENPRIFLDYLAVGPRGEVALNGRGSSSQVNSFGVLLERDAAGETRLSLSGCQNCEYVRQVPLYDPKGRPVFVTPRGGGYTIYDTASNGYFEIVTRGQLYTDEVFVQDLVFTGADSVLTSTTVMGPAGLTSAELGYVDIPAGRATRLHRTEGNSYTFGSLQRSPSGEVIQYVFIAGAYTAIVVGRPDGTSGIRQVSPVSRRLRVENPAREHVTFYYVDPPATGGAHRRAYLSDAAGRRYALPAAEDIGDGRYRVLLPIGTAAGTYALIVDSEAALVLVQ